MNCTDPGRIIFFLSKYREAYKMPCTQYYTDGNIYSRYCCQVNIRKAMHLRVSTVVLNLCKSKGNKNCFELQNSGTD